jgi:uncharacterized membrane protein YgcG
MSSATNYCLKGPDGTVVGFRLRAEALGHRIYDVLDWADEHFSSHFVEQTDGQVYVCSDTVREIREDEIRAEPLEGDGPHGDGSSGGRSSGGPSGGGPSGGSGGSDPDGKSPVGDSGGGAVAAPGGF